MYSVTLFFSIFLCVELTVSLNSMSDNITDNGQVTYLIVEAPGSTNLIINVTVTSELFNLSTIDPCPTVQWTFRGDIIENNSDFVISDPCSDGSSSSPYTFTLTITTPTIETSGEYSAMFTVLTTSMTLHIIVTVPS